jgi:hypothetical protein
MNKQPRLVWFEHDNTFVSDTPMELVAVFSDEGTLENAMDRSTVHKEEDGEEFLTRTSFVHVSPSDVDRYFDLDRDDFPTILNTMDAVEASNDLHAKQQDEELRLMKENLLRTVQYHVDHCMQTSGEACTVNTRSLRKLAERAGIVFTDDERRRFF